MATSKSHDGKLTGTIDILLPNNIWVTNAVERAQCNKIDLGFAEVPVITPEDLVLAKCLAFQHSPDRFQDLDDLKELFLADLELDIDYLGKQSAALVVTIPQEIHSFVPAALRD